MQTRQRSLGMRSNGYRFLLGDITITDRPLLDELQVRILTQKIEKYGKVLYLRCRLWSWQFKGPTLQGYSVYDRSDNNTQLYIFAYRCMWSMSKNH